MKRAILTIPAILAATGLLAQSISVSTLEEWLAESDPPVLIDLRSATEYSEAHLPGAINIPWMAVGNRKLPPLGVVVAYGSGLGREREQEALVQLAAKPGIEPHLLEGGMAAWVARALPVAGHAGVRREELGAVTYQEALTSLPPDAVLVDMRPPPDPDQLQPAAADPVSEFANELGRPLSRGLPAAADDVLSPAGGEATEPLLVLIDDDTRRAEETARRLRDQGHTRVVILVGGVEIIQLKGKSGVQRIATGVTIEGLPDEQ